MEVTLFSISVSSCSTFVGRLILIVSLMQIYTFMWISVDRYLAVRKPLRYETVQTRTRKKNLTLWCSPSLIKLFSSSFLGCQCWMCFTWISAAMLCCPSLWTEQDANFDKFAYICVPNWSHMAAYSVTLGEFY